MCASEFACVAGVMSANVLHLFAFCISWQGVLPVVCPRMCCVFVLCVDRECSVDSARVWIGERVCGVCACEVRVRV